MPWLSIITTFLSLVGTLISWLNNHQMLQAGADQEIARQLAAIMAMMEKGREIFDEVHNMDDDDLAEWLKELGRH